MNELLNVPWEDFEARVVPYHEDKTNNFSDDERADQA